MTLDLHAQLRQSLHDLADPVRAEREKRYLKSTDQFIGVTVPASKRLAKAVRREQTDRAFTDVRALAEALWAGEFHEEKRLAVQLFDEYRASLTPAEWPLLLTWVREAGSWDLVDEIAAHLLGSMAERYPEYDAEFDSLIQDCDFWVRRAALVSCVVRIRHRTVSASRVCTLCDSLMTDREYFVRKALGWVLRECATIEPEYTVPFLRRWAGIAPRMILREAVRKLEPDQQQLVLG